MNQKEESNMRDSFIFYRSFYEAIKDLPRDVQGEIYTAIMEYSLYGKETEQLKPIARSIFTLIRPQIDINNQRYENGKKGGRRKTEEEPNDNQTITKHEPNVNDNVNVNDIKEIDKEKPSRFYPPTLEDIKNYCDERNNKVNAEGFFDFYTSKGWMIGKNKMKDWKSAIRTWERKQKEEGGTNEPQSKRRIHPALQSG